MRAGRMFKNLLHLYASIDTFSVMWQTEINSLIILKLIPLY